MRILFLSQVLPYPLDAGPKMRSYYVLRHLAQQHQVTLLTFVRATDRPEDIAHLAEFCETVHTVPIPRALWRDLAFLGRSLITSQPFLIVRDQVSEMNKIINRLLTDYHFDAVHADQLWMAQYALAAAQSAPAAPPRLILDQHNAVQLIPRRMAADETNPLKRIFLAREARLLTHYETDICRLFDHVVWVTAEDRQAVLTGSPSTNGFAPSTVIPICTDPGQAGPLAVSPAPHRITFLGGLHWPPNAQGIRWFADEVFPKIRAAHPEAVLTVIGKNPPAGIEGPQVEITGYVTDPHPWLAETAAFIVPLHAGGGMRVKILDAWSWGLPIVSTTIGAEGIAINPDENILIADTALAFAQAVSQLLSQPETARQVAAAGRQTVLEQYNWHTTYREWDNIYQFELST
jgi:glycosyltransferase involved in cell wall biosynthesis